MPDSQGRRAWPVLTDDVCHPASALFGHRLTWDPIRKMPGDLFLDDPLVVDAVGIALHRDEPIPHLWDHGGSDLVEVADEIGLRYRVVREKDLLRIGNLDGSVTRLYRVCHC
jgi:hypothetical protein